MEQKRQSHWKVYLLILLITIFGPIGNVLLGKGMKQIGPATAWEPGTLLAVLVRIGTSGFIWLGIGSLLTSFFAYLLVLNRADYSYVQPSSSFSYATIAVLGYFILGEVLTPLRLLGIGLICLGVFIVGRTSPRATKEAGR